MLLISPLFLPPSIPAKAGISFSRQREFSAKRNIAMVACRRMRLRRRDSCLRRNGRGGRNGSFLISPSISFLFPPPPHFHSRESGNLFPRQREIPRSGMVACRRMRLSPQRFLPTQEWKWGAGMEVGAGMERGAGMEVGTGMERGDGNRSGGREWKEGTGMEVRGGNERYCRLSHPPPLAGGG